MCGIVGYVGDKQAQGVVIEGLRRLEYRGYDSAGIALVDGGRIAADKRAGKLVNLEKAIEESPLPEATTSSSSVLRVPARPCSRNGCRQFSPT